MFRTRPNPDHRHQHAALLKDQSQTLCTACFHQQERYELRDPELYIETIKPSLKLLAKILPGEKYYHCFVSSSLESALRNIMNCPLFDLCMST